MKKSPWVGRVNLRSWLAAGYFWPAFFDLQAYAAACVQRTQYFEKRKATVPGKK
jgi:hypothetical protein